MSSLYFHIPFCERKCVYCDFYSIAPIGERRAYDELIGRFLKVLDVEVALRSVPIFSEEPVNSIFFGGGTPSLLKPSDIERLLESVRRSFHVAANAEITLETNPGTVDRQKLEAFRAAGINRLSVGVQSFHEEELIFLTRIHSAEESEACVRAAFAAGFSDVSIDLIFAMPDQSLDRWRETLAHAVALKPTHISCYSLIVEPNTPLARMVEAKHIVPLAGDQDAEQYEFTMTYLADHGFEQYEVSNFALPGYHSRHNCAYWDHSNYLGFGPSAHSFWNNRRWWNSSHLQDYMAKLENHDLPIAGEEILTPSEIVDEHVFLGLRTKGIDLAMLKENFHRDIQQEYSGVIKGLIADGVARLEHDRLILTPKGRLVCDEIASLFR